ncbi:MAG: hypothetical protein HEQ29_20315 [Dolichospermum sp. LBC05a]|nr:hypothetical protein [Dolichospermum sp. OL01]MCO5798993.1 hypothetical protein [Dolichospermum sp. OL03]QSV60387.1 MAG: hypothetical protein HEQ29_20315 [Dolichospermum sp. LBC05a]
MPTGGSASTVFTVFEAEPQSPIPSRSLGTSSGLTGCDFSLVPWLCWGMPTGGSASTVFTVFEAEPQSPIPSRSLGTSLTVRYAVANAPYKLSTNQQLP